MFVCGPLATLFGQSTLLRNAKRKTRFRRALLSIERLQFNRHVFRQRAFNHSKEARQSPCLLRAYVIRPTEERCGREVFISARGRLPLGTGVYCAAKENSH